MSQYYPETSNIDLREELHAIIHGRADMVPQGREFLLRRMTDTPCACYDETDGGGDQNCPYCLGEGWQFTESLETLVLFSGVPPLYKGGYLGTGQFPILPYGYGDPSKAVAYAEYDMFPDYERYTSQKKKVLDKLYELKVDDRGRTVYPLVRAGKWKVVDLSPVHGDHGRIEYFTISLDREFAG
jgi:hypothetical protein